MAVRIQLASNFQVVELTGETWMDIDEELIEHAIKVVNDLGKRVVNDIKTAPKSKENKNEKQKKDEPSSEKQVQYAVSLGLEEKEARNMTKGQIWSFINRTKKD